MDDSFSSPNTESIKHFFDSNKTFFITFGEKGIGKSTFILSKIKTLVAADVRIVTIQAKYYQNSQPLMALCAALYKPLITSQAELLKDLCKTSDSIFVIENPHLLMPDDAAILLSSIQYTLHSNNNRLRIILEFDGNQRYSCFLDSLITIRNSYMVPFKKMSPEVFFQISETRIIAPSHIKHLIFSNSEQNFSRLDDILLMLIEKGSARYGKNNEIICEHNLEINLKNHEVTKIILQYENLDEALKLIARYSALMGPFILSTLLNQPLNVPIPKQKLEKIKNLTGWLKKDASLDFWKQLFSDSEVYNFVNDIALKTIREISSTTEKDDIYPKLAKYLEKVYDDFPKKDILLHMAGVILATIGYYYERYDIERSVKYNHDAGECFSKHRIFHSSAKHYEYCFNHTEDNDARIEYFRLLIQALINAEQNQKAYSLISKNRIIYPKLMQTPQIQLLYADVLYKIGKPDECLEVLLVLEKELSRFKKDYFSFQVHSLLASVYDWENNAQNRKKHFQKAIKIQSRLSEDVKKLAFCQINKKANMLYDFNIPEIQMLMKQAMKGFQELNLYKESWECAHNIGFSYLLSCNFEEANQYLYQSMQGFQKIKSREVYVPLNSIGILHMIQSDFEKAHHYFNRIDIEIIEPFCAYSVLINKMLCETRYRKKLPEQNNTILILDDLEKTNGDNMELRLPYINLQVVKAFIAIENEQIELANDHFNKVVQLCDYENDNFNLPGFVCAKMLKKYNGKNISDKAKFYISRRNILGDVCINSQIIICDFLFWK